MIYLVVLDANSTIGANYYGKTAKTFLSNNVRHPVLVGTELGTTAPYYLMVRATPKPGADEALIYIPHGAVAAVFEIDDETKLPVGFI